MKLITLNLWGGKLYEPLMEFVKTHSADTDIFCFQDALFGNQAEFSPEQGARLNLFNEIDSALPEYAAYIFRDPSESYIHGETLPPDVGCGQVMLVKNNLEIIEEGGFRSHEKSSHNEGGDLVSGRIQWIKIKDGNSEIITVVNLHGLWKRDSKKLDVKERLEQSDRINEFLKNVEGRKILCGDFNIHPETEAMAKLEDGMINLIKKQKIESTRNKHYPKEEKFADYVLVSPEIKVKSFKVVPDEVSDHLALKLEFE